MKIKPCDELNSKGQVGPNMGTYLRFLCGKNNHLLEKKTDPCLENNPPPPRRKISRQKNQRKQQRDGKVRIQVRTPTLQVSVGFFHCFFVVIFECYTLENWHGTTNWRFGSDDFPFQLGEVFLVSSSNVMLASGGTNISHPYHMVVK